MTQVYTSTSNASTEIDMRKWDGRFIQQAELVASWSKDPSTKVGAVIVRPNNTVASVGYNGFPRGVDDSPDRLANREEKLSLTIHAELNAILNAREDLTGCSIYVTHPPCVQCACAIKQAGIEQVIYKKPTPDLVARWGPSLERALKVMDEAGLVFEEVN